MQKEITLYNKYNWIPIKLEYVEGYDDKDNNHIWPTMGQLAKKHHVPPVYLRKIASDNDWTKCKKAFLIKYEQTLELERVRQLAKKANRFDEKCISLAEKGIKEVESILNPEQPILNENGVEIKYDLNTLELAAKTLEKFQKIGRLSLGINNEKNTKLEKSKTLSDALNIIAEQMPQEDKDKLEQEFIGND